MGWKDRLKRIHDQAYLDAKADKRQQSGEREKKRDAETSNRLVYSRARKVCEEFARQLKWEFSTDATKVGELPCNFYIYPSHKRGDSASHWLDRQITVALTILDNKIRVKPPGSFKERERQASPISFAEFEEERLVEELESMYKRVCFMDEEDDNSNLPEVEEEDTASLNLGWYYSENKDEFQMAKVAERDRATHLYVIGATGTGKTKFLEYLIQQDIDKGNGFGVIDPHGDMIEDIKGFLACYHDYHRTEEIFNRVILIDPTDPDFTVTFNPLEKLHNVSVAEQAGELVSAFRKIWSDSWGVRMEDLMRHSLIALGEAEFALADLTRFLTERRFRETVLQKVEHPIAQQYFQRFNAMTDRGQLPVIEPVMNKINAFLADHRIRHIFSSSKSSFNLREAMDSKKILLIKLDRGKLKDSADLLGSLLMAKIQMAAFSRSDIPPSRRVPFHLYIDEFQNFASESFMVILSEARKYGLSLTMAHQTLAQIPEELRSLILGNTGLQVYFRVNRHDAQLLAKEAFDYSGYEVKTFASTHPVFWTLGEEWEHKTEELQNLPPRCCYAKHKTQGGLLPLFTADVVPAWEVMGMQEDEYLEHLKGLPLGKKYLVSRQSLITAIPRYLPPVEDKIETAVKEVKELEKVKKDTLPEVAPVPPVAVKEIEDLMAEEPVLPLKEAIVPAEVVPSKPKVERQHRYLQSLIKRIAEEKGYRAVIEASTPDGGRVDIGLEQSGKRIACEISVTSTDEQELSNIEKCLRAGYDTVILCSPERKNLERIRALVIRKTDEADREKLFFLQPEELFSYLESQSAILAGKEERVKGYKVKVQYQALDEDEKKARRETIAQVILQSLRRQKEK
jgi:hypothetical protein